MLGVVTQQSCSRPVLQVDAGSLVVFRCSDIGKFKFLGEQRLLCRAGELQGETGVGETELGTCQGLNQAHDYSRTIPPTILFR